MDWIFQRISSPESELVAQIPVVLAGLFHDATSAGLSAERFFHMLRRSLLPLHTLASGNESVEAALGKSPGGESTAERVVLLQIHDRIPETLQTARRVGVSPSRFAELWTEIAAKFEVTAKR